VEPFLDHVAIRVGDRAAMRDELVQQLDFEVIEENERLTLLGPHPDHGKLTLLDAEPDTTPVPVRLMSIMLAVPAGAMAPPPLQLGEGLRCTFATRDGAAHASTPRHAVIGMTIRSNDPPISAARLGAEHGMSIEQVGASLAVLRVDDAPASGTITLCRERFDRSQATMLDHVGIRVPDARAAREQAERDGLEIVRWVEAPHSNAVFVEGPEGLLIEYVELTRAFAA
jgi:hypothetical protein